MGGWCPQPAGVEAPAAGVGGGVARAHGAWGGAGRTEDGAHATGPHAIRSNAADEGQGHVQEALGRTHPPHRPRVSRPSHPPWPARRAHGPGRPGPAPNLRRAPWGRFFGDSAASPSTGSGSVPRARHRALRAGGGGGGPGPARAQPGGGPARTQRTQAGRGPCSNQERRTQEGGGRAGASRPVQGAGSALAWSHPGSEGPWQSCLMEELAGLRGTAPDA